MNIFFSTDRAINMLHLGWYRSRTIMHMHSLVAYLAKEKLEQHINN